MKYYCTNDIPDTTITGDLKKQNVGIVDFLAEGYIIRGGERIPCELGWIADTEDEVGFKPDYIFIKQGITEAGTHYCSETICLL